MPLWFRAGVVPLILLGVLVPAASGLAQTQGSPQSQPAQSPAATQPAQLPSTQQLRDRFMGGCLANGADDKQRSYCSCVFRALMARYTPQHYVLMDNLIISAGPAVSQFASLAWGPEFAACRSHTSTPRR